MPKMEIEFEVVCGKCGTNLDKDSDGDFRRGTSTVIVRPCSKCLEEEFERGEGVGRSEVDNRE